MGMGDKARQLNERLNNIDSYLADNSRKTDRGNGHREHESRGRSHHERKLEQHPDDRLRRYGDGTTEELVMLRELHVHRAPGTYCPCKICRKRQMDQHDDEPERESGGIFSKMKRSMSRARSASRARSQSRKRSGSQPPQSYNPDKPMQISEPIYNGEPIRRSRSTRPQPTQEDDDTWSNMVKIVRERSLSRARAGSVEHQPPPHGKAMGLADLSKAPRGRAPPSSYKCPPTEAPLNVKRSTSRREGKGADADESDTRREPRSTRARPMSMIEPQRNRSNSTQGRDKNGSAGNGYGSRDDIMRLLERKTEESRANKEREREQEAAARADRVARLRDIEAEQAEKGRRASKMEILEQRSRSKRNSLMHVPDEIPRPRKPEAHVPREQSRTRHPDAVKIKNMELERRLEALKLDEKSRTKRPEAYVPEERTRNRTSFVPGRDELQRTRRQSVHVPEEPRDRRSQAQPSEVSSRERRNSRMQAPENHNPYADRSSFYPELQPAPLRSKSQKKEPEAARISRVQSLRVDRGKSNRDSDASCYPADGSSGLMSPPMNRNSKRPTSVWTNDWGYSSESIDEARNASRARGYADLVGKGPWD